MPPKPRRHKEEEEFTADTFLSAMRLRTIATFISTLMVLYSFFGSIYRMPMQIEQQSKVIQKIETTLESVDKKVLEVEKKVLSREGALEEAAKTRARVDALEKAEALQGVVQSQILRLTTDWRDLTQQLDNLSTQITQLTASVATLKETTAETHRAIDELKRK